MIYTGPYTGWDVYDSLEICHDFLYRLVERPGQALMGFQPMATFPGATKCVRLVVYTESKYTLRFMMTTPKTNYLAFLLVLNR